MKSFARDVTVNVLANLIAAALIYLLGIMAGLFPRKAEAVNVAIIVVLVGSFAVMAVAAVSRFRLQPERPAYRKSLYVSAVAGILGAISFVGYHLLMPDLSLFERVTGVIGSVGLALLVVGVLVSLREHRD